MAQTSQSPVAAYEAGTREPSLPVLDRMVRASGHVLGVTLEPDPRLFRLVDLATHIRAAAEMSRRMRLVFEFLRGAGGDGHPLFLLVAAEPEPTDGRRFDALLGPSPRICVSTPVSRRLAGPAATIGSSTASGGSTNHPRPAPARWCTHPRPTAVARSRWIGTILPRHW
ncbi:MAG: helix-turn-helix domain-containing protein [Pseudonocardiaceae bacterium]